MPFFKCVFSIEFAKIWVLCTLPCKRNINKLIPVVTGGLYVQRKLPLPVNMVHRIHGWLLYFHMGPIHSTNTLRNSIGSVKPCYKFLYFVLGGNCINTGPKWTVIALQTCLTIFNTTCLNSPQHAKILSPFVWKYLRAFKVVYQEVVRPSLRPKQTTLASGFGLWEHMCWM